MGDSKNVTATDFQCVFRNGNTIWYWIRVTSFFMRKTIDNITDRKAYIYIATKWLFTEKRVASSASAVPKRQKLELHSIQEHISRGPRSLHWNLLLLYIKLIFTWLFLLYHRPSELQLILAFEKSNSGCYIHRPHKHKWILLITAERTSLQKSEKTKKL